MDKNRRKVAQRRRRHGRVRKTVEGTPERPRLCVFRSGKHIYCQVIDDWHQQTLVACSSLSPEFRTLGVKGSSVEGASQVGALAGQKCIENGITAVVFDRGGYRYHGRVKALAEGARAKFKEAGAPGF